MRQAVLIGGFVLVSGAALAGWLRKPSVSADPEPVYQAATLPSAAYQTQSYQAPAYQSQPGYQAPVYANHPIPADPHRPLNEYGNYEPAPYGNSPAPYAGSPAPYASSAVYRRPVECRRVTSAFAPASYYGYAERPVVRRRTYAPESYGYAERSTVTYRRPRPFSHSVAIVGGSAGAGAAIGALAGGGKGAGIGALAGGAAGLIYDRLTHNR